MDACDRSRENGVSSEKCRPSPPPASGRYEENSPPSGPCPTVLAAVGLTLYPAKVESGSVLRPGRLPTAGSAARLFWMTLLLSIALLVAPKTFAPVRGASPATLCGIELSPPSLALFRDVEGRLGKTIRCETHLEFGILGASDIAADGTPEIVLDTYAGKTEENLVHELFHLQLHAKGFPQRFQVSAARKTNKQLVQQVAEQLGSLIEHRLFYPQMRGMGFDPTRQYREGLEALLSEDKLYGPPASAKRIVTYAEVSLLIQDPAISRRVEAWYARRGWTDQLSRGKRLVHYLATFNPDTPEKKRAAVAAGLAIVFGHGFDLTWFP